MLSEEALFGEERRGRCVTVGITESKRKTIIESEGESGEETSDYEIFQVARSTQNIRVMFNVLFSSEEVQAEGLADVEPPEEWMQRPKTVGHLAIDQLLIWLLKSHTHKKTDPLRKYYCNLSVIVQLALEHDIIPELIRMITNGQDNALYLLFHLSRVNIYCDEIMRSQEENLLDCLDMTFLQNKKPQMNILAICSMIQVVCNSNALANWLLKEYDLKLKITETFNLNHSQSYMELQWKTILVTTVAASLNYIAGDILEYVWNEHLDIDSIISQELGTRLEENQIINEYNSCDDKVEEFPEGEQLKLASAPGSLHNFCNQLHIEDIQIFEIATNAAETEEPKSIMNFGEDYQYRMANSRTPLSPRQQNKERNCFCCLIF